MSKTPKRGSRGKPQRIIITRLDNAFVLRRKGGGTLTNSVETTPLAVNLRAQLVGSPPPGRFRYEIVPPFTDVEEVHFLVDPNDGNDTVLTLRWYYPIDPQFYLQIVTAGAPAPMRYNDPPNQRTTFTFDVPAASGASYEYKMIENAPPYRLKVIVKRQ